MKTRRHSACQQKGESAHIGDYIKIGKDPATSFSSLFPCVPFLKEESDSSCHLRWPFSFRKGNGAIICFLCQDGVKDKMEVTKFGD